jgi:hypothetical protein
VMRGVKDVWAEIGGYNANPIAGSEILAMARCLQGMRPDSPLDETRAPQPGAWVRTYQSAAGKSGRVFASTYGGSGDFENEGFRRMVVNACFWAAGLDDSIKPDAEIGLVGPYRPSWLGTNQRASGVKPEDLSGWDSPIWPAAKR